jgi:6-phosphogluconolactonase
MTVNVADLRIFPSAQDLFSASADEFVAQADRAVQSNGKFTVALAGGSTPKGMYRLLAELPPGKIAWDHVFVFFGDERHVPPDHPDSNFRMASEALLSKVHLPPQNIFRVPAENPDAAAAAADYEGTLRNFFGVKDEASDGRTGAIPRFDLVLLGMGPDGHAASLFPYSPGLKEQSRWVIANRVEKFNSERITLTYPVLNGAACVMFLVSGAEKQDALFQVLRGKAAPDEFPSQAVQPLNGKLIWMVDQAAGARL